MSQLRYGQEQAISALFVKSTPGIGKNAHCQKASFIFGIDFFETPSTKKHAEVFLICLWTLRD